MAARSTQRSGSARSTPPGLRSSPRPGRGPARARQAAEKGPSASLAPSAARSTYREYASRTAVGRRLASGPFCAAYGFSRNLLERQGARRDARQFGDGRLATSRDFPHAEHRSWRRYIPFPSRRRMATSMFFLPVKTFVAMQSEQKALPGCWPRKFRIACCVPLGRVTSRVLGWVARPSKPYVVFASRQAVQGRVPTDSTIVAASVVRMSSSRDAGIPLLWQMQSWQSETRVIIARTAAASSTEAPPRIVRGHAEAERLRSRRAHQHRSRDRSMTTASSAWSLAVCASNDGVSRAAVPETRLAMAPSYLRAMR